MVLGKWRGAGVVTAALALVVASGCASKTQPAATRSTRVSTATASRSPADVTRAQIPLAPSPRMGASMAFDPATKSVVLFGGLGVYGTTADTWSWDGAHWHALAPAASATSRLDAGMTYDPISRTVLMLGGEQLVPLTDPCTRPAGRPPVCTPGNRFRGVALATPFWGWDVQEWKVRANARLTPGTDATLVTQSDGTVLAFGNGTWTFDGKAWHLRAFAPADVIAPIGMALDPVTHQVIAVERFQPGVCMPHSGCEKPAYMRTFTWTGSKWRELADRHTPFASGDAQRGQGALVADPPGGGLLMLATDGSTWRRSGGDWRQVATKAQSPPALEGMTMVADPASRQVVAFGGTSETSFQKSNVTWVWDGSHWRELTAPIGQTSIPDAPAAVGCHINGPALVANQQTNTGATVHVMGSGLFLTSPCDLKVSFTFTLVDASGRRLAVAGNPSVVKVDTHTTAIGGGAVTITWLWTHACASTRVHAEIKAAGAGANALPTSVNLKPVPACHGAGGSTLHANPYRIT